MKRMILTAIVAGVLVVPTMNAGIRHREKRQGARIHQGVHNGSLTRREAAGLSRNWVRLDRSIRRDRHDGGGLTKHERVKIHHRQDRLSRQIYRQKHDGQTRGGR